MEDKIKNLEASIAGLQAKTETLEAQNAVLAEQVATLTDKLENFQVPTAGVSASVGEEKRKPLPEAKPFKIGSKEVRFKYAAFHYQSEKLFAYQVCQDKALREKIAAEYPGLIEPVE